MGRKNLETQTYQPSVAEPKHKPSGLYCWTDYCWEKPQTTTQHPSSVPYENKIMLGFLPPFSFFHQFPQTLLPVACGIWGQGLRRHLLMDGMA